MRLSAVPNRRPAPASIEKFPVAPGPGPAPADPFVVAALVGARDPVTGLHLGRVGQIAYLFGRYLALPPPVIARLALGGYLHDIGKVDIPDSILKKPARLDAHEVAVMRTHPETGVRLLGDHPVHELVRAAVLYHHERPDGGGYPFGLRADQIPFDAKVVGIVDAFDAMTSDRPYRQGMTFERALQILEAHLGSQVDAHLGTLFLDFVRSGGLDPLATARPRSPVRTCEACGPTVFVPWEMVGQDAACCARCGSVPSVGG